MKRRIYEILTNPRPGDTAARIVSFALMTLIAVNVIASIAETDADVRARFGRALDVFELISTAIFTIEYVLRLWSCTVDPRFEGSLRGRLRMMLTPMALIDLVAIAPSYVDAFFPGTLDLRFLRVMRLMRLFRLFRIGRLGYAFNTLVRVVQAKRVELGVTLGFVMVATVVAAGAIYLAEHQEPNTAFTSIPRAMWWAVVTITTVGYGDMFPVTAIGKVIGGFVAFVGICALALPVGILSAGFIEEMSRQKTEPAPPNDPNDPKATASMCPHCGGALE